MEGLLVLAVAILVIVPLVVIGLVIAVVGMRGRLARIEGELVELQRRVARGPAAEAPAEAPRAPLPWDRPRAEAVEPEAAPSDAVEADAQVPEDAFAAAGLPAGEAPPQDGPIVMRAERASAFAAWLRENWVYAVSAVSLALAGIFLVQYGMERGLLPPAARVALALLLGAALIAAGEWIRRRHGDGEEAATAYLPSTFSGAGIVTLFAGVLAARLLYGLIGTEAAFAGLLAVAALSVVLGWFHGPFLIAVGLVGATLAPFAVGGGDPEPWWLYGYFALVAVAGLAVDAVRRWAWVSVLALALAFGAGWFLATFAGGTGWFAMMCAGLALAAIAVPVLSLTPAHDGPTISEALAARGKGGWPGFPVRLAGGAMLAASLLIFLAPGLDAAESWLILASLVVLVLAVALWAEHARALADLALVPAALFLLRLAGEGAEGGPLWREHIAGAIALREPETSAPLIVPLLLALAVAGTLAAAWRSFRGGEWRAWWAAGAAVFAPAAGVVLELFWSPAAVLGPYPWALAAIALAALMVALAERFARIDGEDRRRMAYAVLSALAMIAFALFVITSRGALTVALSVLVVAAAALDRRFRLPEMAFFIQAGVVTLGWRLVVDPGIGWAVDAAPLWEVMLSYAAAIAAMAAGLRLLAGLERGRAAAFLDSGLAAFAALFANVLILRWFEAMDRSGEILSHWGLSLNALPWLILALVQLYRMKLGGAMAWLRAGLAAVAGLIALAGLLPAATALNPLFDYGARVPGPQPFDTLAAAYLLPAVLLFAALPRLGHQPLWLRRGLGGAAVALLVLWIGLSIRRFWQGDMLALPGVSQPELYSYTVAMLLAGAGLLWQAIARRSAGLRRAAMTVIALTVAKVFLIDASGLSGLTRVFSFLALGLSLAGLAWLNRWAAGQGGPEARAEG